MLGSSLVNGGSECCNTGGKGKKAVKKPVRKYKAKRGGNAEGKEVTEAQPAPEVSPATEAQPDQPPQQDGGARKKKGSKVAAKRAPTPYNKFVKAQFAILKKKFPDDKAPQIMKKIAIEWKKTK